MADYIRTDFKTMGEIWNDLLQLHWDYLDTEENMEKLEMRRKLEGELKDFLGIVQHDRKFFLTETAHVFKQSIMKMDEFTAYKALMGFEAISQYANNLFRKPWRKEYRCIKMYSGYYQHEVKANLTDAEKLFEAMGYTLLPNHTLVLDGPICPDQVTNVSRDAMTAYVECQIMKQIFQSLTAMQLQTTWQEIYEYREMHIGIASHAIKAMACAIEKRRHRKEKQYESCYSNVSLSAPPPPTACISACNTSSLLHHPHHQSLACSNQHHLSHISQTSAATASKVTCNALYSPLNAMCSTNCPSNYNHQFAHASIPHSKSLEHYHEPAKLMEHHHARHSFDQPPTYDYNYRTYDCVDGATATSNGRSSNYHHAGAAENYHQPTCNLQSDYLYNVSGNRYPLPSTISNQLAYPDHHYAQIGNFERNVTAMENFSTAPPPCCHQNSHYECLNSLNGRGLTVQKPINSIEYNNYNFPPK